MFDTKKSFIKNAGLVIFLVFFSMSAVLYAESDNGRFLSTSKFSPENFYLGFEPQLRIPLIYSYVNSAAVSSLGFGGALNFGYNLDGWLLGIRLGSVWFGPAQTGVVDLKSLVHINAGISASKIIGSKMIAGLPYWLAFAPEIRVGASFLLSEFIQPEDYTGLSLTHKEFGVCAYTDISVYVLFPFHEAVTPYVGYINTLQFVSGGVVYSGAVSIGVRLYPGVFAKKK